jgi:hypothetical protein
MNRVHECKIIRGAISDPDSIKWMEQALNILLNQGWTFVSVNEDQQQRGIMIYTLERYSNSEVNK